MSTTPQAAQLDHLVIAAASLADGVQWCERTLGVTPGPGGVHPLMGTHNRLLSLVSPGFPNAYLEIIAIDSEADPAMKTRASSPNYTKNSVFSAVPVRSGSI